MGISFFSRLLSGAMWIFGVVSLNVAKNRAAFISMISSHEQIWIRHMSEN